jgi:hypothetical protein
MKTHKCDCCNEEFTARPWMLICPRPSDPYELVCTMLTCPECGQEQGFVSPIEQDEMSEKIERGEPVMGAIRLFDSFVQANW